MLATILAENLRELVSVARVVVLFVIRPLDAYPKYKKSHQDLKVSSVYTLLFFSALLNASTLVPFTISLYEDEEPFSAVYRYVISIEDLIVALMALGPAVPYIALSCGALYLFTIAFLKSWEKSETFQFAVIIFIVHLFGTAAPTAVSFLLGAPTLPGLFIFFLSNVIFSVFIPLLNFASFFREQSRNRLVTFLGVIFFQCVFMTAFYCTRMEMVKGLALFPRFFTLTKLDIRENKRASYLLFNSSSHPVWINLADTSVILRDSIELNKKWDEIESRLSTEQLVLGGMFDYFIQWSLGRGLYSDVKTGDAIIEFPRSKEQEFLKLKPEETIRIRIIVPDEYCKNWPKDTLDLRLKVSFFVPEHGSHYYAPLSIYNKHCTW